MSGVESDPFLVNISIKQGLAPVILNLFLVAITLTFRHGVSADDSIKLNYHLNGNLFNIRRLQAKTQTSSMCVFDLQYADDAAIPSHSADGLQRNLDSLAEAYQRAGLLVNTKQTEMMTQAPHLGTTAQPSFPIDSDLLNNGQHSVI